LKLYAGGLRPVATDSLKLEAGGLKPEARNIKKWLEAIGCKLESKK
jgi:hypothetical protein